MCGRNVKLFFLLIFFPLAVEAKTINFATGSPFGMGVTGGVSQNPTTDLVSSPYTENSAYSYFVGIDPFLDFENFILKGHIQYHNLSIPSGPSGSLVFTDTSDSEIFLYGGSLLLVPFISDNKNFRIYFRGGVNLASLEGENARTYASGAKYVEKFSATGLDKQGGIGMEVLFVQNYSLALDFGYRELSFDTIQLESGTSLNGTAQLAGTDLVTDNGTKKSLKYNGLFASLSLNLNF